MPLTWAYGHPTYSKVKRECDKAQILLGTILQIVLSYVPSWSNAAYHRGIPAHYWF